MNRFTKILKEYWNFDTFRPLQLDIIESVYNNQDTLALLPTGGGKSLTFQVPALAKEGLCLVVTPLIALMLDQVQHLKQKKIPAEAIYSGMTQREIELVFNRASANQIKFLYLSPERLKTELFQHKIRGIHVNLIAVDEAHCISQWGYDFRPAYLEIAEIRQLIPDAPILALTASATSKVVLDIQKQLDLKKPKIVRKSFFRDNLIYISRKIEDKYHYLVQILNKVQGTGIVYVRNRKQTYEIAQFLYKNGISADYYHAGLSHDERKRKQELWQNNQLRVIVSTNAFGMGIDKADVRTVIHMDLPDSLESYYQEAGRGGRDGATAYAGIIYNKADLLKLTESLELSFPPIDEIKRIYAALGNFFQLPIGVGLDEEFEFDLSKFASTYQLPFISTYNALKLIEREGWIQLSEPIDSPSKIHFIVDNNDLYRFYIRNPDFETFIRILLRNYQGIFTSYVNINEFHLAKKASISVETVKKYFRILQENHILLYLPRKSGAYLRFLQERMDEKYIHISKSVYSQRKTEMKAKIKSMIHFVTSTDECRSALILKYFGETYTPNCGICDVCVENQLDENRIKELETLITNQLKEGNSSADSLCQTLMTNKSLLLKACHKLQDEKIIHLNEDQLFELF